MFSHFIIISRDEAEYVGGNSIKQLEVIDMSVPHDLSAYDKSGYKRFVLSMKSCIFGNKSARITKQRAEEFFNDEANFVSDLR